LPAPAADDRYSVQPHHRIGDLIELFNGTFLRSENTELVRGEAEPIYLPADADYPHDRIVFAHGFYASALHEIAHWCIAGTERRRRVDYGYWYRPDGRDAREQAEFERVEARPQAIEWALSIAAGFRFEVSVDNLSGVAADRHAFRRRVHAQLAGYCRRGFPPRAERFMDELQRFYGTTFTLPAE
jgi:elongation factor P hydroxylase